MMPGAKILPRQDRGGAVLMGPVTPSSDRCFKSDILQKLVRVLCSIWIYTFHYRAWIDF